MSRIRRAIRIASVGTALSLLAAGCHLYTDTPTSGACAGRKALPVEPMKVGIFGAMEPSVHEDFGSQAARFIISDGMLRQATEAIDRGETPQALIQLRALHDLGVTTVVAVRFPETEGVGPGQGDPDRIPQGTEREASLDLLERFAVESAGVVDWIQLGNEPVGGPGAIRLEDRDASIEWYRDQAERLCETRRAHPELADLRLMSPGLTGVSGQVDGAGNPETAAYIEALIGVAESHLEAVDVHLHVDAPATAAAILGWVGERTTMPLAATEWSMAKSAKTWLQQKVTDPSFGTVGVDRNVDFVRRAYEDPVTAEEWAAFVAASPHEEGQTAALADVMATHGVRVATYGGAFQYGSPLYDLKALYANMTVVGRRAPNEPFASEVAAVIAAHST